MALVGRMDVGWVGPIIYYHSLLEAGLVSPHTDSPRLDTYAEKNEYSGFQSHDS